MLRTPVAIWTRRRWPLEIFERLKKSCCTALTIGAVGPTIFFVAISVVLGFELVIIAEVRLICVVVKEGVEVVMFIMSEYTEQL
mgnify:FL=1